MTSQPDTPHSTVDTQDATEVAPVLDAFTLADAYRLLAEIANRSEVESVPLIAA
jgi:hypothetical protein